MSFNLKGKNFLKLLDFSSKEIRFLLDLSKHLKISKYAGTENENLKGKNIALIFEKTSTRTRCAFETAAYDQGARVTYLGPVGSQMGKKESIIDTAKVLGRMYDGIEYRGFGQDIVEDLGKYAGVPVWNGLTDMFHPTQILADFLTIEENFGKLEGIKLAYVGDGRNNVANSLMIGAAKMGLDFRIVCPKELEPTTELLNTSLEISKTTGAKITITNDIEEGIKGIHAIYTDVWVSMGEPESVWEERIKLLLPYQVNKKMMDLASPNAIFLHCLPAFHDLKTITGKEIYEKFGIDCMEVSDEVFLSKQSKVFDEAENRTHTIKAVMIATLGN